MDRSKFDISVQVLFKGGVNEQFLKSDIKFKYYYKKQFRGNSKYLCLFSPERLYKKFIKEKYDIIVSYLEGPTARIVSGCNNPNTKLVSWIHIQQETKETAAYSFRSYQEAKDCYDRFDQTICVSEYVKNNFQKLFELRYPIDVLLFPSLFDGLPVTLVEVQTSGLKCVISDNIPKYCILIDEIVQTIPLNISAEKWAEIVVSSSKYNRFGRRKEIINSGFDIIDTSKWLEDFILKNVKSKDVILTIFTPAYNRAHAITRTYESLCKQNCKDFIWLIVDDGSTDNTAALVKSWQEIDNGFEIRYVYKKMVVCIQPIMLPMKILILK